MTRYSDGRMKSTLLVSGTATALLVLTSGCASTPPPELVQQMTRAETSIAQAEQSGAPSGALAELQQARDKQASAKQSLDKGDYELAMRQAKQAQLDAQYAATKSQAAQAQTAAAEVQDSLRTLKQEGARPASPSPTAAP